MKRFTGLIALAVVVSVVAAMGSSFSITTLGIATAIVAAGVLAHKFVPGSERLVVGAATPGYRVFMASLFHQLLRFAIAAVIVAWSVVTTLAVVDVA